MCLVCGESIFLSRVECPMSRVICFIKSLMAGFFLVFFFLLIAVVSISAAQSSHVYMFLRDLVLLQFM